MTLSENSASNNAFQLSKTQFEVLFSCIEQPKKTQREIALSAGISLGAVNKAVRELCAINYLDKTACVTVQGMRAMQPYRVQSAVILAAGMAKRFAPLSFEKPKAMFEVRGEILIERLIRQLKQAGISNIVVVVGYMKEEFFYLEDEFGVSIEVNPQYAERGNYASLYCARAELGNSYVCCSDEYYPENIFRAYEYRPYLSVVASGTVGAAADASGTVDAGAAGGAAVTAGASTAPGEGAAGAAAGVTTAGAAAVPVEGGAGGAAGEGGAASAAAAPGTSATAENKYLVTCDKTGRVKRIAEETPKNSELFSVGPAYFNEAFSQKLLGFIQADYDAPETYHKIWESVLSRHISQLEIYAKKQPAGTIYEFDTVADLVAFDRDFFANVDSCILDNICKTLNCTRDDISNVSPVKAGLTNLSTLFSVQGQKYIYRHPGTGTEEIVNRKAEALALNIAKELGLDDTFIFEQPDEGWKISRYIEGCSEFDYRNKAHVQQALQMGRRLHTSGKSIPYSFDFYDDGVKITNMLRAMNYPLPRGFDALAQRIGEIATKMRAMAGKPVLCHNDFYGPNFLVRGNEMRLIDWEYAAMGDAACDLGNFVAQGSGYSIDEALDILPLYFGRPATEQEQWHFLAAVAVVGWYWYVWAMYKGAMGNPVGEWLYIWYRSAKLFSCAVLTNGTTA